MFLSRANIAPLLLTTVRKNFHVQQFVRGFALMSEVNNDLPEQMLKKIHSIDSKIRAKYDSIDAPVQTDSELDQVKRKRIIYRSKQRGWLEADLLMGSWAEQYVPTLSKKDLDDYEEILKEETIDIYNYISGTQPTPERLQKLEVMKKLQEYAKRSNIRDPVKYEELKVKNNLT